MGEGGGTFPVAAPPVMPGECPPVMPARPRVWSAFLMYAMAFGASSFVGTVILFSAIAMRSPSGMEAWRHFPELAEKTLAIPAVLIVLAVGSQVMTFAGAACGAGLSPVPWRRRLRLGPSRLSTGDLGVFMAGTFGLTVVFGLGVDLLGIPQQGILKLFEKVICNCSPRAMAALVLVVGVFPGLGEELLFRGYIQTRLSERWGPRVGVLLTAVGFGVMHMDLLQGVFAFLLGMWVGWLVEKTGSLRPAILCHMAGNTLSLVFCRVVGGSDPPRAEKLAIFGFAALVFALALARMARLPSPRESHGEIPKGGAPSPPSADPGPAAGI